MTCDVILPVWSNDVETVEMTGLAIETFKGHRLIIIDNGSTVGGGQLRDWADVYIRNKQNLGYAKAVNQGLKLAGSLVAVANNDIRVSSNWWEVAEELLRDPKVGSVHYRMIGYDQPFYPGRESWKSGKERWCSASFFVTRNVQLYDECFLNSCDDWDYFFRLRQKGYTTAYTNKAEYQHKNSFSQNKRLDRYEYDIANHKLYKIKHGMSPEEQFEQMYPGELVKPWLPMP
jgi:GT2 family glycosyltransferase